jgi:DNA invertase Pin-like site-specific DNA recombinase
MKTDAKRVALYARVSTNRHRCRTCKRTFPLDVGYTPGCPQCGSPDVDRGQDPDTQVLPLREYVTSRGMSIAGEYVDRGVSGSKDRRPELDRMMTDARRRRFDVILVARFDRLARSTKHLVLALEEFNALGIDFISLNESVDTSTPLGKMVFTVIGAVAELERSLIRERVMMGLDRAKRQGKQLGRPRVLVDREKVERLRAEGLSLRHIANMLNVSKDKVARMVET